MRFAWVRRSNRNRERARSRIPLLGELEELLTALFPVPRTWMAFLLLLSLASCFQVQRSAGGDYTVDFRVTWITALLAALIWLPALLKVISVAGGGVKTPAGEASTTGLASILRSLSPAEKQTVLPNVIAGLDNAETQASPQAQPRVRELRASLETELAHASSQDTLAALDDLARQYESLRKELPPGDERTFLMTRVVAQARAIALGLKLGESEARQYFQSGADGSRIIALAIAQATPSATLFNIVLEAVSRPKSAFEQFHALRALDEMLGSLSRTQKKQAKEALEKQRQSGPGSWITPDDRSRWEYSANLLRELG